MPQYEVPADLFGRLRVLASKESARRRRRLDIETWLLNLREDLRFNVQNLMKPMALPVAGGLSSAFVLFSLLVPHLTSGPVVGLDVDTGLTTAAQLDSSVSFSLGQSDIVLDVFIDDEGRVMDYTIPAGHGWARDPEMIRNVANTLLCTRFKAATWFGKKAAGRTRIRLTTSHMEVRG